MWTYQRVSLKDICFEVLPRPGTRPATTAGCPPTGGRSSTGRGRCGGTSGVGSPADRLHFKTILEDYLETHRPGWDVLRGARGVFKEPHVKDELAMCTMDVRDYLSRRKPGLEIPHIKTRFPTAGAENRFGAVLICEKEGFDELLQFEAVPDRYDLALMSTKGISARAARDLARSLGVPCFMLHDFDKNGFVMAHGFPLATDIGLRMNDVEGWGLNPETQRHSNPDQTYYTLIRNGATAGEADYIANGRRVELNELTGPRFIEFVEAKLNAHGVKKVIPDAEALASAWRRARLAHRINDLIDELQDADEDQTGADVNVPDDLATRVAARLEAEPSVAWDDALWDLLDDDPAA